MAYWNDNMETKLKPAEKRQGPDPLVKWVRVASLLCWLLFFITILIWDSARPQIYTILDAHYGKVSRTGWATNLLNWAFVCSIVTFAFNIVSLLFNSKRLKRKNDKVSISLVVCMIASGLIMLGFFMYFVGLI